MKRIFYVILAALLALSVLAACGGTKKEPVNGGTTAPGTDADTAPATEEVTAPYVHPTADLNNGEINIMIPEGKIWWFDDYEGSWVPTTMLNKELLRNVKVQDTLNCELVYRKVKQNQEAYSAALAAEAASQDGAYDMVLVPYDWNLETSGYFMDLLPMEEIDLSQPWFVHGWNDIAAIRGQLRGAVGYGVGEVMSQTVGVFYNKTIFDNQFADYSVFDYVDTMSWTLDTMLTMARSVTLLTEDAPTLGWKSESIYGVSVSTSGGRGMFWSLGGQLFTLDENGDPTPDFMNDRNITAFDKSLDLMNDESKIYIADYRNIMSHFSQGKALFAITNIGDASEILSKDVRYGILPCPLLNEDQKDYVSFNFGTAHFAIPKTVNSAHNSAVLLNEFNYFSDLYVRPAYFDTIMKERYAQDPDSARMVDLIMKTVRLDFASIYNKQLDSVASGVWDLVSQRKRNYVSEYRSRMNNMDTLLENLVREYTQ